MRVTTLGELGPKLPIGFPKNKQLVKDFDLRPYKTKVDRCLGLWKEANENLYTPGQLLACQVAKFISLICSSAGGVALPVSDKGDSLPETELKIHNWYFADVLYLYLYARVKELGKTLVHPVACPNGSCAFFSESAQFDLTTIDVRTADTVDELSEWYTLESPFLIRDSQTQCKSVKIEPIRWSVMAQPGMLDSTSSNLTLKSLQSAICAINGDNNNEYRFTDSEMDEMSRRDRVLINRKAGSMAAGVSLETNIKCPKCGTPIVNPLNWTFDYFFDASLPLEI